MITSTTNSKIKQIEKLHKSARERKKTGLYLVEGIRMFVEIPPDKLECAYATEAFYQSHRDIFQDRPYELVSEQVFKVITDTMTPQGVLSVVKRQNWKIDDLLMVSNPLLLVLENIQDPGNLGTILRTAEGAGVNGVIMSRDTVDIYNSKVVRSTMGSIFRVPFVYVEDVVDVVYRLKEKGITSYAAHLNGQSFYAEDYRTGCAFLIGNEGNGLTEELSKMASNKIKIPMKGNVESLNAATAATVLIYEAFRQRSI